MDTRGEGLDQRRLRKLIDVGRGLVSELDLETVLNQLLDVARELTDARYAAIGILDARRVGLERFIFRGIDPETRAVIGDLPRGRGVLGTLIQEPKPLRLAHVGQHPRSYGFPPGHPPMESFLGVPIAIRGQAYGNLYLTEKRGGEFNEADEEAAIVMAEWAAIAIENARLYADSERRRDELERAVRGLEATTEVARAIGGETEIERILETIAKRGRALIDARSLVILIEENGELMVAAIAGEADYTMMGRRLPIEGSTVGRVLRSLDTERVADIATRLGISAADLGVEASSAMLVPLIFRGEALGVIVSFDRLKRGPEFDEEDEQLLRAFAASAATAVATAQTVAKDRLRRTIEASEQERGRWARELHDETLQGLGAVRVLLASALQRASDQGLKDATSDAVAQIGTEIDNLRSLISELRPAALEELGLGAAIEGLAERTRLVEGVAVDMEIALDAEPEAAGPRRREMENAVYRTIQEALNNVGKHARAENVRLRVSQKGGGIEVFVRDDGVGFEPGRASEGFGLVGMRERVEIAGGRVVISSGPGDGTTVWTVIPGEPEGREAPDATAESG